MQKPSCCEPQKLEEILESQVASQWKIANNEELKSLEENKTWILTERPNHSNVISNRWIFKRKHKADGTIGKYKARLFIRGYA